MKNIFSWLIIPFVIINISGCAALIVGGAVGALGGYAISKDTIQGETDKPYDSLWDSALMIGKIRGTIIQQDRGSGYIQLEAEQSKVYIRLIKLTSSTTRVKVKARKYHLPNLDLAQDIFVKIMEQVH